MPKKKLTLQQKLIIYRKLHNKLENLRRKSLIKYNCGMCHMLMDIDDDIAIHDNWMEDFYPELNASKPPHTLIYWWPRDREGLLTRMRAVRRAIRTVTANTGKRTPGIRT